MKSKNKKIKKENKEPLVFRKPSIAMLILKKLSEIGYSSIDAFFPAKYPEARIWRKILGLDSSHKFSKQTFHSILWRLQKQKLVERNDSGWGITDLGKKTIKKVKYSPQPSLSEEDGVIRLVIFDIPERDRKKRVWLRLELIACGFNMLQKSVWIGQRPLPQEFFESLDYLNIRPHVHIVSVERSGTLRTD